MQPLNDDDMDELLRRAAEDYPLNTDSADWNKVIQQLHGGEEDVPEEFKKKKDFKYLWLLLLLPIGFICGKYAANHSNDALTKLNSKSDNTLTPKKETSTSTKAIGAGRKPVAVNKTLDKDATDKSTNSGSVNGGRENRLVANAHVKSRTAASAGAASTGKKFNPLFIKRSADKYSVMQDGRDKDRETQKPVSDNATAKHKEDTADATKVVTGQMIAGAGDNKAIAENKLPVKAGTSADHLSKTNSDQPVESAKNAAVKQRAVIKSFKRNLYYSLLIGPDVSMVKLQRTSKVGYSVGLMLGYQLSSRISVEAGALWDRKNYYSKGDYLDTGKLQLPMHSIVSKAEGMCNMIEIPVNVKYEFISKKRRSWFISTGFSSYLMKKENYNLSYQRYNQPYVKDYDYTNSSKDWFSIVSISIGYKASAGKTNVSIAPYAKLPLRGVGIGKLPVTSAGFYVILSRSVH